jgi:integration host factor subunit alpha
MVKADLVMRLVESTGFTQVECFDLVEVLADNITKALAECGTVKVSGFGTFQVRKKSSRPARNPKTGEVVEVAARSVVTFRASEMFKDRLQA